ncbi:hypothetical protein [Novosphingobium lentum]|uniref:hypothetical protein n=1 Tax=Novosphingobium lentum TaxID=145287 RepID=UPI0012EE8C07|nr:hypothetical protein [Novosphingobium lentum]
MKERAQIVAWLRQAIAPADQPDRLAAVMHYVALAIERGDHALPPEDSEPAAPANEWPTSSNVVPFPARRRHAHSTSPVPPALVQPLTPIQATTTRST